MRRILIVVFLFLAVFPIEAKKHGLLVGVGNYPEDAGWRPISSVNDIVLLKKQLGSSFNLSVLVDDEATCHNILNHLDSLTSVLSPGDTVFVHFSCHGQQMLTCDEDEPDMLDETIVPYDAKCLRDSTYYGQYHLKDDVIGRYVTNMRRKIGPGGLVIYTVDSCFSDSMNKGDSQKGTILYRGGYEIFGSNYVSVDSLKTIYSHMKEEDDDTFQVGPELSDVILVSACRSYQKNREINVDGIGYGSLSYSICQAFMQNSLDNMDAWIESILSKMHEVAFTQDPQVRTSLHRESQTGDSFSASDEIEGRRGKLNGIVYAIVFLGLAFIVMLWKIMKK